MKAVIYCRVSTEGQADNTSLPAQLAACQKKAGEIGATVVAVFSEIESGGLYLARPQIQEALALIEAKTADTLIVMRLDRSGREVGSLRDIRQRIARAGGQLVFADGLQFDASPVGDFVFTTVAGVAELERKLISDRTHKGTLAALKAGRVVSVAIAPFGYHISRHADVIRGTHKTVGELSIIEEQAAVVREMFALADAGKSLRFIAMELQKRGHLSPKFGEPQSKNARRADFWNPASVRTILRNPVHKGEYAYGKGKYWRDEARLAQGKNITARSVRDEADWLVVPCPAIVSADLWERVQQKLRDGRRDRSGPCDARNLLTGLLRCPQCGGRMNAHTSIGRHTSTAGESLRYSYRHYACRAKYPEGARSIPKCESPQVNAGPLEKLVTEALLQLINQPGLVAAAWKEQQKTRREAKAKPARPSEAKRWQKELSEIQAKEAVAAKAKVEAMFNNHSADAFDALLSEMAARRRALEAKIEATQQSSEKAPQPMPGFPLFSPAWQELWQSALAPDSPLPPGQKNAALQEVVESVTYTQTQPEGTARRKLATVKITLKPPHPTTEKPTITATPEGSFSVVFGA